MPQSPHQRRRRPSSSQQSRKPRTPSSSQQRKPRSTLPQRRIERPSAEPVDYSRDYAFVKSDLIRIATWSIPLLVGMFAIYFIL